MTARVDVTEITAVPTDILIAWNAEWRREMSLQWGLVTCIQVELERRLLQGRLSVTMVETLAKGGNVEL